VIALEIDDGVARVTINRPEVLNALDEAAENELTVIWEEIEANRSVFLAVLTGVGDRAFCVGADLHAEGREGLDYWAHVSEGGFGGIATSTKLSVPVLARVNGYALGGGFEMLLGCDLAVATDDATFGFSEPLVGRLALAGGIVQLPRRITHKRAMELLLTARRISAAEAFEFGLVNQVVPRVSLDAAVEEWIVRLRNCSPLALRAIKQMVIKTAHLSLTDAMAHLTPAMVTSIQSQDAKEGVLAFSEHRPPKWEGQ
jgi:enoyl-CoA hydratase/carnithine racemase